MPNTTWDPLDKYPTALGLTLSSGNLVVTGDTSTGIKGVRAVDGKTTGKYYFEITVSNARNSFLVLGVGTQQNPFNNLAMVGAFTVNGQGQIFLNNSSQSISLGNVLVGDTVCFAIDFTNNRAWARRNGGNWNNNAANNPATNVGGIDISSLTSAGHPWFPLAVVESTVAEVYTANFGDTTFAQTVPSGFTSGWPANSSTTGDSFDPGHTSSGLTLSNSNHTVLSSSPAANAVTRSTTSKTSGKWYFEFYCNFSGTNVGAGVGNSSITTTLWSPTPGGVNGAIYRRAGGVITWAVKGASADGTNSNAPSAGHTIQIAIDLGANLFWARVFGRTPNWNNSGTADPATGAGGFDISGLGALFAAYTMPSGEANTTYSWNSSTNQKLLVPSGFTAGFTAEPAGPTNDNLQRIVNAA